MPNFRCRFGCSTGKDSIEHLAYCPQVRGLLRRHLGLASATPGWQLDEFLGLCWAAGDAAVAEERVLYQKWAIGVYALYRLHNALRYAQVTPVQLDGSFQGYLREGRR